MPVSNQETVFPYTGNGVTTSFAYECQVLDESDLHVYLDDVEQSTGFIVTGIGNAGGGDVEFDTAPADGVAVRLERIIALERTTNYQQQGDFQSPVVNMDFDRTWMAFQQHRAVLARALLLPSGEAALNRILPSAADRAGTLIGFDDEGRPIAVTPTEQSAAALSLAIAASSGASLVGFQADGVGAVPRTLQDKGREYPTIADYFQVGESDYTAAAERATAANKFVRFTPGIYVLDTCDLGDGHIYMDPGAVIRPKATSTVITFNGTFHLAGKAKFYEGFWFHSPGSIQCNPSWGYINGVPTVTTSSGSLMLASVSADCEYAVVLNGGSGATPGIYQELPITGGGGAGGLARVLVADDGSVSAVGIRDGGAGYTSEPTIDTSSVTGLTGAAFRVFSGRVNNTVTVSLPEPLLTVHDWITSISDPSQTDGQKLSFFMCPDIALAGDYTYAEPIYPENFGAIGNGVENDAPYINVAMREAPRADRLILSKVYMIYSQLVLWSYSTVEWLHGADLLTAYPTISGHYVGARFPNDNDIKSKAITLINPTCDASGAPGENGIGFGLDSQDIETWGGHCRNARFDLTRLGGKGWQFETGVQNCNISDPRASGCTHAFGVMGSALGEARQIIVSNAIAEDCDAAIFAPSLALPQETDIDKMAVLFNGIIARNCGNPSSHALGGQYGEGGVFVLSRGLGIALKDARTYNTAEYGQVNAIVRGAPLYSKLDIIANGSFKHIINSAPCGSYLDSVGTQPVIIDIDADVTVYGSVSTSFLESQLTFVSGDAASGRIVIKHALTGAPSDGFCSGIWAGGNSRIVAEIINMQNGATIRGLTRDIDDYYNVESSLELPGHVIIGHLALKSLPTSAGGLPSGQVYIDAGTLKIVP